MRSVSTPPQELKKWSKKFHIKLLELLGFILLLEVIVLYPLIDSQVREGS